MENILFSIFIQYNAKICWWKNSEKVLHICHRRCVCCRHIIISGKYRIMDNWFCLTTVSPQAIFICVCVCVFVPNQELIAWKIIFHVKIMKIGWRWILCGGCCRTRVRQTVRGSYNATWKHHYSIMRILHFPLFWIWMLTRRKWISKENTIRILQEII